jgi:hypothetical protein
MEFPRFYFMEREQLIETLSHTRDCRKYLPAVRMCFPGVNDLVYTLPSSITKSRPGSEVISSFDLDIHGKSEKINFI